MAVELESAKRLNALISKANAATGESSATLSDAVDTLIAGFGQSGGGGSELDALIAGTLQHLESNATHLNMFSFRSNNGLVTAKFPEAVTAGESVFAFCQSLVSFEAPKLTTVGSGICFNCKAFRSIKLPSLSKTTTNCFGDCPSLVSADFRDLTEIQQTTFVNDYKLTAVLLRNNALVNLINIGAFQNCMHYYGTAHNVHNPNGLQDGYVYVPKALVELYQSATNWATLYASHPTVFRALEDYTVDGTITGDLDESKI